MNVLVFGLGLHGGGAAAASYFLKRGCDVCITDLKTETELNESLKRICSPVPGFSSLTLHLGGHEIDDFIRADLVIKNTAVPPNHPLLLQAEQWETDLSYFLKRTVRPIVGVTGTKGKSTTVHYLHLILRKFYPAADIAGNIGISLFDIADGKEEKRRKEERSAKNSARTAQTPWNQHTALSPVVIEFSSWQLRDLRRLGVIPNCRAAVITSLYRDHMNSYDSFHEYLADKAYLAENSKNVIMSRQAREVFSANGFVFQNSAHSDLNSAVRHAEYAEEDSAELAAACAEAFMESETLQPETLRMQELKLPEDRIERIKQIRKQIRQQLNTSIYTSETGLPYRLQVIGKLNNMLFINDSASTIPESVLFGIRKIQKTYPERTIHLICGGTDKNLQPDLFSEIAAAADHLYLLPGSFTRKLLTYFASVSCTDYWYKRDQAAENMFERILNHIVQTFGTELKQAVLFSPGAASFEYFPNSNTRGKRFDEAAAAAIESRGGADRGSLR